MRKLLEIRSLRLSIRTLRGSRAYSIILTWMSPRGLFVEWLVNPAAVNRL